MYLNFRLDITCDLLLYNELFKGYFISCPDGIIHWSKKDKIDANRNCLGHSAKFRGIRPRMYLEDLL